MLVQSDLYLGADSGPAAARQDAGGPVGRRGLQRLRQPVQDAPISASRPGTGPDLGPRRRSVRAQRFHIVGSQFDTVYKEGAYLLRPGNAEQGASQTLDLQPSQGGFVELTFRPTARTPW